MDKAQRQRLYDRKHLRTVSTKVTVKQHEMLARYCRNFHTTPYKLLQEVILTAITAV